MSVMVTLSEEELVGLLSLVSHARNEADSDRRLYSGVNDVFDRQYKFLTQLEKKLIGGTIHSPQ